MVYRHYLIASKSADFNRLDSEEVVAARCGDFERPLGALLALDVLEIEPGGARRRELRRGRRQQLGPLEMVDDREEARRRDDLDVSGPGRLAAALQRADDATVARGGGERGEQHARHAGQ